MKRKFQSGDIVKLKSGGPAMTVSEYVGGDDDDRLRCKWFAGAKSEFDSFKESMLVSFEPEATPPKK